MIVLSFLIKRWRECIPPWAQQAERNIRAICTRVECTHLQEREKRESECYDLPDSKPHQGIKLPALSSALTTRISYRHLLQTAEKNLDAPRFFSSDDSSIDLQDIKQHTITLRLHSGASTAAPCLIRVPLNHSSTIAPLKKWLQPAPPMPLMSATPRLDCGADLILPNYSEPTVKSA